MNRAEKEITRKESGCCKKISNRAKTINALKYESDNKRVCLFNNECVVLCERLKVSWNHIRKIMDIEKYVTMSTIRKIARYED